MEAAINHFLNCTARWTPRWFNKPKFHIIRHLVDHIRRFGPAILFATEGFESFNAVIRTFSVHSNHKAPSRDIGRGFGSINRIRHLLSGGRFFPRNPRPGPPLSQGDRDPSMPFSDRERDWRVAGSHVLEMPYAGRTSRKIIAKALGLEDEEEIHDPGMCVDWYHFAKLTLPSFLLGTCIRDKMRFREWGGTLTSQKAPRSIANASRYKFGTCFSVFLTSNEKFILGNYILATDTQNLQALPIIGRVKEILQVDKSDACHKGMADFVLLEVFHVVGKAALYGLPVLQSRGWQLVAASVRCLLFWGLLY